MALGRATAEEGPGLVEASGRGFAPANDAVRDPRIDALTASVAAGERRATQAVARLGEDLARLALALEGRLQSADARVAAELEHARADLTALERMVSRRLGSLESGQAELAATLRAEIAGAVDRLSLRLAAAERESAQAVARLEHRLGEMAVQASAGEARMVEVLDGRLAETRARTEGLVSALHADLDRRDAALAAHLDGRIRRQVRFSGVTGGLLALALLAGAASISAAVIQMLAAATPRAEQGPTVVRMSLPLRPTLPAELPAAGPELSVRRAPSPAPRERPAPRPGSATQEDLGALASAVARGDREAVERAKRLAEAGSPVAQLLLAKLYEDGLGGLPRDLIAARQWTERAAQAGDRAAMHNLAVYLMNGEGGASNAAAAAGWFQKAAAAGVVDAQFNLGLLYENGRGAPKNLVEAYRWFSIAANAGDGAARARAIALEPKLTRKERGAAAAQVSNFEPGRISAQLSAPIAPPATTVAESQKLLARAGYFIGATDGADSPTYRSAVEAYLEDHPQARRPPPAL